MILNNGRTLDGVIRSEDAKQVVLDLGVGSMTVRRSQIRSIERADAAGQAKLEDEWRKQYFLHKRHVPAGLETLAESFQRLADRRTGLRNIGSAARERGTTAARVREDLRKRTARMVEVSETIRGARAQDDVMAYNRLIAESNALRAEIDDLRERITALETADDSYVTAMREYREQLRQIHHDLDAVPAPDPADESRVYFIRTLRERLAECDGDLIDRVVQTTRRGNSILVPVIIGAAREVTLVLDTGAELVTLTADAARRLGVDLAGSTPIELTLADGQKTEGRRVVLSSVRVAEARADNVAAVVVNAPPGTEFEGLLGMSFLRNFLMSLDPGGGTLTLTEVGNNLPAR